MRLHVIQHVDFEGPGLVAKWAREAGHAVTFSLALTETFPQPDEFDWLVVLGGPMSADDEDVHPWLGVEKRLIASAIDAGKMVLGICLGAQIVAEVIGGRVRRNAEPEIGWFTVHLSSEGASSPVFGILPDEFTPVSWHGDTFDLPQGIRTVASSEATANQAFEYAERVWGLQFHLEWDKEAITALLERCGEDLASGRYVQSAEELLGNARLLAENRELLFRLLDAMEAVGPRR